MTEQEKRNIVNTCLTLYIGECPHDWKPLYGNTNRGIQFPEGYKCSICGKEICPSFGLITVPLLSTLDFYQPNDRERLFKWIEENQPKLWEDFLDYCFDIDVMNNIYWTTGYNNINPSNLFDFLVRERARWEWVECSNLEPDGLDISKIWEGCGNANNDCMCIEGKIKHPTAVYLDRLREDKCTG